MKLRYTNIGTALWNNLQLLFAGQPHPKLEGFYNNQKASSKNQKASSENQKASSENQRLLQKTSLMNCMHGRLRTFKEAEGFLRRALGLSFREVCFQILQIFVWELCLAKSASLFVEMRCSSRNGFHKLTSF